MKKVFAALMAVMLIAGASAFADDVVIDSSGNVTTGVNGLANLEVFGNSAENVIRGNASDTGAAAVLGVHSPSGNYGYLGDENYGVYGFGASGYAGYFDGNVHINGTLSGVTLQEDDPEVGMLIQGKWCTSDGSVVDCDIEPPLMSESDPVFGLAPASSITTGNVADWNNAYGWGDHSVAGYDSTNDSWTGTGNVTMTTGNVGIGETSPTYKLHLKGSNPRLFIDAASSNPEVNFASPGTSTWSIYKDNTSGDLNLYQSGNKMTIQDSTGFVGIGQTNPAARLHVNGLGFFDVPSGSVDISSPGAQPGIIAFLGDRTTGLRRDIVFNSGGIRLRASADNSAPDNENELRVEPNGTTSVKILEIRGGADLSEQFDINSLDNEIKPLPGMVVSIDPDNPGELSVSSGAYDRRVAGIISGAGGISPGMLMGQEGSIANGSNPVALTGRVYAWVDASQGAVKPGDLLTTSATPGHAMKVSDYSSAQGAIIGKAMTSLEKGKGLVLVLVTLQ